MSYGLYNTDPVIRTFTGKYVNVFEPKEEMFCIEDIAHALSNQCRFGGHLPKFYSVAQHSYMCASIADTKDAYDCLMHDASEAYLLDIPTPIKSKLAGYKEIEHNLMLVLAEVFGFTYPLSAEVKNADKKMLELEWELLMLGKHVELDFKPENPQVAELIFLNTYKAISGK